MATTEVTQLYHITLDTADAVEAFADILHPFLPYSLPILGCLYSGDIDSKNNIGNLHIWTSFPFEVNTKPPPLFSVIASSGWSDMQMRYFCSAEVLVAPPTPDEEHHVRGVLNEFIRALKANDSIVQCINPEALLCREEGKAIFLGSLHERWIACLASGIPVKFPCTKFVSRYEFQGDEPVWNAPQGEWEIGELQKSDLEFVISRATFPRSFEFMVRRLEYSVCIRRKGIAGPPVAWEVVYPDGSSGMLHVEPEYRNAGLGRKCVAALSAKMRQRFRCTDERLKDKYPFARWEMTDVVVGNDAGLRHASSREGTKQSWVSYWASLTTVS
ncbi:hypothetical protein EUX98_g3835 [Antrodiella citrinella]|uniref:FR47-like domain-containing protein n=1 Tax=Antrodiella citrinella TaxID=2447956 RepID=A0A4S4MWL0_9APHY|nr:hypothetical protein EUX98_g3835 [Antrodiella citrinella]